MVADFDCFPRSTSFTLLLVFAREILIEEGLFFILGLFSACVLSDLLLTWTILLSFALGIVFWWQVLSISHFIKPCSCSFSFPILIGILVIHYHLFKEIAKVKDQRRSLRSATTTSLLMADKPMMRTLLIHWSHEELFFQYDRESTIGP